ncbi:MAG: hypothetical protein ACM3IJ_02775 [Candidatus Levyibacteriota bacterium]
MSVGKVLTLLIIGIATIISSALSYQILFPAPKKVTLIQTPVAGVAKPPKTASVQSIVQVQAEERTGKALSIDGTQSLTMKSSGDLSSALYSFYIQDNLVLSLPASNSAVFSVPDNAWDPEGTYFFIEKMQDGVRNDFAVKTSGEDFSDGQKYLDLLDLYKQKNFPYVYKGATGWAGYNLMMVETENTDGTPGPLFWFEVPSASFIQLAQ